MSYIVKFIEVPGEVKAGDYFLRDDKPSIHQFLGIKTGNLGMFKILKGYQNEVGKEYESHIVNLQGCPKLTLHLCTKDVQVGDLICGVTVREWNDIKYLHRFQDIELKERTNLSGVLVDGRKCAFMYKPIAEISTDVTWIKEDDKLSEENIQLRPKRTFSEWLWQDGNYIQYERNEAVQARYTEFCKTAPKIAKIKGPCGHFH